VSLLIPLEDFLLTHTYTILKLLLLHCCYKLYNPAGCRQNQYHLKVKIDLKPLKSILNIASKRRQQCDQNCTYNEPKYLKQTLKQIQEYESKEY